MIELRMPASSKELRIKHFNSMSMIPENGFNDENGGLLFLAEFTGLQYNRILDFTMKDIGKMITLAVKALSTMDVTSKLPKTISLKGQEFYLVEPDKVGIGWHIDFKNSSIVKDPVRLACLFYLPKGYSYSDVDENGNILYPLSSRHELFENEFPLDLFIRCSNFFLKRSLTSIKRSTVIEIARSKTKNQISSGIKILNLFNGKRLLKRS